VRYLVVVIVLAAAGCGGSEMPLGIDMTVTDGGGPDLAGDGGLKLFGSPCASNAECASNVCFMGGNRTFCSMHCMAATQATDCPMPPTSGICNTQGYCKP
jgi:hypothetical protein